MIQKARSRLEEVLIDDVATSGASLYHKLTQMAVYKYESSRRDLEAARMEYMFYFYRNGKGKGRMQSKKMWPADVVIRYNEGNKRIVEIIEVRTMTTNTFRLGTNKIKKKLSMAEEALPYRNLNHILYGADEVRFSIAISTTRMDKAKAEAGAYKLARRLGKLKTQYGMKTSSVLLVKDDLFKYCPGRRYSGNNYHGKRRELEGAFDGMPSSWPEEACEEYATREGPKIIVEGLNS